MPTETLEPALAEFIFEKAPFRQCHASTLVETADHDILASWFGGSAEGNPDVGIWLSRRHGDEWSSPRLVADEPDVPCWNPILFRLPEGGLWLFYKAGRDPCCWSGFYARSDDGGETWSEPTILPAGLLGPVKNKPISLSTGEILFGTSVESYRAWTSWVEKLSRDRSTWTRHGPIEYPGVSKGLIQPTLVELSKGKIRAFMRSTHEIGSICVSDSHDFGETWSPARRTSLPNPNAGIDAVMTRSGLLVMVYNHSRTARTPLSIAVSEDGGETWSAPLAVETEPDRFSYPCVLQTSDGLVHAAYTWKRTRIKHVAFEEETLRSLLD